MTHQIDGTCLICGVTHPSSEMTRHLWTCLETAESRGANETDRGLLLRADAISDPYWLYALAPISSTLAALDAFLREIWLECCGHLSEFTVEGTRYAVDADNYTGFGPPRESMDIQLGEVLTDGTDIRYTYDFGTETRLALSCDGEAPCLSSQTLNGDVVVYGASPVRGIARNASPDRACEMCGESAEQVCSNCYIRGGGFVCEGHRDDHDCDYPAFLPVLNSPRMGICGYTG